MNKLDLPGLRADNLVGFMAAVGTLRSAFHIWPDLNPRLSWDNHDSGWQGVLYFDAAPPEDQFIENLHTYLKKLAELPAINIADDLTIPILSFHETLDAARVQATPDQRINTDFLSAFGSDAVESTASGKPTGRISDTAFRTMSGAGHQHFLGTIRTLIEDIEPKHLEATLFERWDYGDPMKNHSLRWDPGDDVRYALQWDEPSGDSRRTTSGSMWGANRLAVEALPSFTTSPGSSNLITTAFTESRANVRLTWPVWTHPLDINTTSSLLALAELQAPTPDRTRLARRGIQEVFRCHRITQGKFRNFTSARPA